jgi:fructoselysine 6-kinase
MNMMANAPIPRPGHGLGRPPLGPDDVVAVVGDSCIDIYPATGMSSIGGCAPNVAVNLSGDGIRSEFVGRVGDDEEGRRLVAGLKQRGVLVDRVAMTSAPTCIGVLETDERGLTHIVGTQGDCTAYRLTDDDVDYLATRRCVHLKDVADIGSVCEALAQRGVPHSYDYSDALDQLSGRAAQVSFFSCGAGPAGKERARTVIDAAISSGAEIAIATLGADGSIGRCGNVEVRVDVEATEQVDSIGAGDAFIAATLAGLLRGEGLQAAMHRGAAAGAAACRHVAAWPQVLTPAKAKH